MTIKEKIRSIYSDLNDLITLKDSEIFPEIKMTSRSSLIFRRRILEAMKSLEEYTR